MQTYCGEIASVMRQVRALQQERKEGNGDDKRLYWKLRRLQDREDELRQQAALDFAKLNGWKFSWAEFAPTMLARDSTRRGDYGDSGWRRELFDHPVYFCSPRRPYRPVAIVGQPYNTGVAEARDKARQLGLELHVPPAPTASWWYPSATRFFCFTRPGTAVQFLPEQYETLERESASPAENAIAPTL